MLTKKYRWLLLVLLPLLLSLLFAQGLRHYVVKDAIEQQSARFALLNTLRRDALGNYFDTISAEVRFWSSAPDFITRFHQLQRSWYLTSAEQLRQLYITENPWPAGERRKLLRADKGLAYGEVHQSFHLLAKQFVTERGYYDLLLVDRGGNVIYSVEKEDDFSSNLIDGQYRASGLADVFAQAMQSEGEVVFSDMHHYAASDGKPAMFVARLLRGRGGVIGAFILQVPSEAIVSIMHFDTGMGDSGETYLVGEDLLMRSDSRFSEQSTVLQTRVDSETARRALNGEVGVDFVEDYRGVAVLSAYDSLLIGQFRWAVLAEIDEAELRRRADTLNLELLLSSLFFYLASLLSLLFISRAGSGDLAVLDSADMELQDVEVDSF